MLSRRLPWFLACLALAALAPLANGCESGDRASPTGAGQPPSTDEAPEGGTRGSISGIVTDDSGPVAGAVVRKQSTTIKTRTDAAGLYLLTGFAPKTPVSITAWSPGYFFGGGEKHEPGAGDVQIELERHADGDNPDYRWVSAYASAGDEANCENCHSKANDPAAALLFDEWTRDAHSASATNVRFLTNR